MINCSWSTGVFGDSRELRSLAFKQRQSLAVEGMIEACLLFVKVLFEVQSYFLRPIWK